MFNKLRSHLTYANVMVTALMFIVLGGSAYALSLNSVRSKHIKNGQVKSVDVRNNGLTGADILESSLAGGVAVPTSAVMFFNRSSCPSGWTELTSARGRSLVGLPSGGTLGGTQGTALTNLENRPVGQHNHPITDPSHRHGYVHSRGETDEALTASSALDAAVFAGNTGTLFTDFATTGITVDNAGAVSGTNAPYLQLLACQKS